jgi:hypothetical protein
MTGTNNNEDRDTVLYAFHLACERPTAEQIIEWANRYPQHAADIRAHATATHEWALREDELAPEPDEAALARGYSNVLNLMHQADAKHSEDESRVAAARSFHDIAAAHGKEVYEIAEDIDIARGALADLFNGVMLPPIRHRIIDPVCRILHMTREAFDSALAATVAQPRFGPAKSNHAPTVKQRPCDEIIRDSGMRPERIRYFLEED